jgi:hypothetical protein
MYTNYRAPRSGGGDGFDLGPLVFVGLVLLVALILASTARPRPEHDHDAVGTHHVSPDAGAGVSTDDP